MRLYPLGYPMDIHTNHQAVLAAAGKSWGAWPALFDQTPVRIDVEVHPRPAPRDTPSFEAPAGWLKFSAGDGNLAAFKLKSRTGHMRVGRDALRDEPRFRHHWLDAFVLTALDSIFF